MDAVGKDFDAGDPVGAGSPAAANAMKAAMEILRPLFVETGVPKVGTAVIGTVKGDIHDMGKNLVGMMWEGAGFKVINLGVNVDADKFLAAIHRARDAARHVGAADDDHALHAEGHRAAGGRGAGSASRCWWAARRSTRRSPRMSARTAIARTAAEAVVAARAMVGRERET